MRKHLLLILFLFVFLGDSFSQERKTKNLLLIDWDNDVLLTTDKYYLQGMKIDFHSDYLKYNPINYILIKPKSYDNISYGLSLSQETYTPQNIQTTDVQYNDYPYAGVLLLNSSVVASNQEKGLLLKSGLDLGVLGPYSGAGEVQYYFHYIINDFLPQGWDNQLCTWPIINYNFEASKEVFTSNLAELIAFGAIRAGSLHDDIGLGFNLRLGKMQPYILSLGNLSAEGYSHKLQYYFELEPSLNFVAYNATLQGGWMPDPDHYYVKAADLTNIVFKSRIGLGVKYKSFGLDLNLYYSGKEFEQGESHLYHNFRFYIPF